MYYVLLDDSGNRLGGFSERGRAVQAFHSLVDDDASAAEDVVLLMYGADGKPLGSAITYAEIQAASAPLTEHLVYTASAAGFIASLQSIIPSAGATAANSPVEPRTVQPSPERDWIDLGTRVPA